MPTVPISVDVADIKRAIVFYSKALGCEWWTHLRLLYN